MTKKLSDMNLEELWELFPVVLAEHNTKWENKYKEMETHLREKLCGFKVIRINHIGSTAINSILAKPIIDILLEIDSSEDMHSVSNVITSFDFIKMSESEKRISFNYGYTNKGFANSVFHLHLRYKGDNDELYFRDYLNEYPKIAHEYEKLKLKLWHKYERNRDAYTSAKSGFVNKYTLIAKKQYGNRY